MSKRTRARRGPRSHAAAGGAAQAEDGVMEAIGFDARAFVRDEAEETAAALAARTPDAMAGAVARAAAAAERQLALVLEVLPPDPPIACADGCAFCCYLRAEASGPEVLRVADHLRATLPAERLAEVGARVAETAARVAGLDADARAEARVPCALLVEGRCSVYEVRPFACRACNSADPRACEEALSTPEATKTGYAPQSALYRYAATATARALAAAGLSTERFELNGALAAALATPDATARWLAGERVLEPTASRSGRRAGST